MKKLSLIIASSVLAFAASAQGVFSANNNYDYDSGGGVMKSAFVIGLDGLPLSKATGRVDIRNASDLAFLGGVGEEGKAFFKAGAFTINDIVVPGVPVGGTANIFVQVWDSSTGATFATATVKAQGLVAVNSLGGGTTPNATFAANSNFIGLTLVDTAPVIPEPSTVALAGLGLVGLLFVARRK